MIQEPEIVMFSLTLRATGMALFRAAVFHGSWSNRIFWFLSCWKQESEGPLHESKQS